MPTKIIIEIILIQTKLNPFNKFIKILPPKYKNKIDIITWNINRKCSDNPLKSSIKLIIAKGIENKSKKFPFRKNIIIDKKTKDIPPALGFIILWELLSLGISLKYILRNGIIFFVSK